MTLETALYTFHSTLYTSLCTLYILYIFLHSTHYNLLHCTFYKRWLFLTAATLDNSRNLVKINIKIASGPRPRPLPLDWPNNEANSNWPRGSAMKKNIFFLRYFKTYSVAVRPAFWQKYDLFSVTHNMNVICKSVRQTFFVSLKTGPNILGKPYRKKICFCLLQMTVTPSFWNARMHSLNNSTLSTNYFTRTLCPWVEERHLTAKPTERQKRLTILADSLAKLTVSWPCKFLWNSVWVPCFLTVQASWPPLTSLTSIDLAVQASAGWLL